MELIWLYLCCFSQITSEINLIPTHYRILPDVSYKTPQYYKKINTQYYKKNTQYYKKNFSWLYHFNPSDQSLLYHFVE